MRELTVWEYEFVYPLVPRIGPPLDQELNRLTDRLNDLGRAGWEMVALSDGCGIFKRPKEEPEYGSMGVIA